VGLPLLFPERTRRVDINEFRTQFRLIHRVTTESVGLEHENLAIQEALSHHSLQLPCRGSATVSVESGEVELVSIHPEWGERWKVDRVVRSRRALPLDWWDADETTLRVGVSGLVRVDFVRPHILDDTGTTLRDDEVEPVCHLAAHFLLAQLSNEYMRKRQSSLTADAVNWDGQNVSYFVKSQDEMRRYQAYINLRYRPGSARADWDSRSRTGRSYIFRDGRYE